MESKRQRIDNLPEEAMLMIFGDMSFHNLMKIRDCSKKWKRIAGDNSLYRSIEIDVRSNNKVKRTQMLENNGCAVRKLKFSQLDDFEEYQDGIDLCPNLESLTIHACDYEEATKEAESELLSMIKKQKNLNSFIIDHSGCISRLNMLVKTVSGFRLRLLSITSQPGLISELTLNKLRVNELKLKFARVAIRRGISTFCENNAENLTCLKLFANRFRDWHPDDKILLPLKQCTNLKTLVLGGKVAQDVTDNGLTELYSLNLVEFEIWNAQYISCKGFERFFARMPLLRKIGLCFCGNVDSQVIRKMVRSCEQLRKFKFWESICGAEFTKHDLLVIAKGSREIRKLRIRFVNYRVGKLLHLLPKRMPHLDDIEYCGISYSPGIRNRFINGLEERMNPFKVTILDTSKDRLALRCVRSFSQLRNDLCPDCIEEAKKNRKH